MHLDRAVPALTVRNHSVWRAVVGTPAGDIDRVFPAADAAAAFDYLARPGKYGKILLEFS
jgi:hypothetical protein